MKPGRCIVCKNKVFFNYDMIMIMLMIMFYRSSRPTYDVIACQDLRQRVCLVSDSPDVDSPRLDSLSAAHNVCMYYYSCIVSNCHDLNASFV